MLLNTTTGYGILAIIFHWIMAIMIVILFAIGIYMHELPNSAPEKFQLYAMHKSFGIAVLVLAVLRLIWRFVNPAPQLPARLPRLLAILSILTHYALYALMLAIPITGWMMVSVASLGLPTLLFGVVELPHLPVGGWFSNARAGENFFLTIHAVSAFFIILLAVLHALAALFHHFILRDTVLRRMLSTGHRGP